MIGRRAIMAAAIVLALFGLQMSGCSSPAVDVESLPRSYAPAGPAGDPGFSPAMVFGPGAAWITGLPDDETFPVGRWVSATPAPVWPENEDAPTVLVGRVAERNRSWARVELLASVDTLRPEAVVPREVKGSLPSVTKRLLSVSQADSELHVPAGTADLITGQELYGVIPASRMKAGDTRLPALFEGLARAVPIDPDTSRVEAVVGAAPAPGDLLVFLGAAPADPLEVRIAVADLGTGPEGRSRQQAVLRAVDQRLAELRSAGIRTLVVEESLDRTGAARRLNRAQRDTLEVIAFLDGDEVAVSSHIERIESGGTTPWRHRSWKPGLEAELAEALVIHAHQLRGDRVTASWLIEDLLRRGRARASDPVSRWLDYGPSLAALYSALWRSDWSLEVRLLVESLVPKVKASQRGRALEAAILTALVHRHPRKLDDTVQTLQQHVSDGGTVNESTLLALASWYNRRQRWNEADRWRKVLGNQLDPESPADVYRLVVLDLRTALERGDPIAPDLANRAADAADALGEKARVRVGALIELAAIAENGEPSDKFASVVAAVDDVGAPALGYLLLTRAAGALAPTDPAKAEALLEEAARFARAARQPLDVVAVLGELESWRLDRGSGPIDGELGALYVDGLATADRRLRLGRRALASAQSASDVKTARDILGVARELFLSTGDALNVAIVEFRLARLETKLGRAEAANAHIERGRRFELVTGDAALTALRRQLEEELQQRKTVIPE